MVASYRREVGRTDHVRRHPTAATGCGRDPSSECARRPRSRKALIFPLDGASKRQNARDL